MLKKFAIIGCGKIAQRHAEHISSRGQLVAVCDIVKGKADDLARRYSAKAYYNIEELLQSEKDIDVVAICTPNGLHAQHSLACLKSGIHVLCEKPMALSVSDCQEMIHASEASGKMLAVVKQNRFNPPVTLTKQLLEKGRFGKIFSIQLNCFWNRDPQYYIESEWKGTADLDGGILFTQFSHFIDLLYWFFGEVKAIQSFSSNFNHTKEVELEDTGVVILEFEAGMIGTINYTINSYKTNLEGSLTIIAEKGAIKIGGGYLNTIEFCNIEGETMESIPDGNLANDYGTYQGSMSNHDKVYDNLIKALNNEEVISTNAFEGMKTVEIIRRIYNSSRSIQGSQSTISEKREFSA